MAVVCAGILLLLLLGWLFTFEVLLLLRCSGLLLRSCFLGAALTAMTTATTAHHCTHGLVSNCRARSKSHSRGHSSHQSTAHSTS